MPLGSSSEAPVIKPGPSLARKLVLVELLPHSELEGRSEGSAFGLTAGVVIGGRVLRYG